MHTVCVCVCMLNGHVGHEKIQLHTVTHVSVALFNTIINGNLVPGAIW